MRNNSCRFIRKFIAATVVVASSSWMLAAQAGEAARVVFVAGKSAVASAPAALNAVVQEGDEITTGSDGYLYLQTIDNGFLILRPNTKARIVSYHVDSKEPANTRIKLELLNGVARSISGNAVKLARQNFRFNTPVAAIGVRGTDFTVFTNQDTSRVTVLSGGIVMSGFGSACTRQGTGPCEGGGSEELFARQQGQLLQFSRDQLKPQLLKSNGFAPDVISPPRLDEPNLKPSNAGDLVTAGPVNLDPQKGAALVVVTTPTVVVPPAIVLKDTIIWGRWTNVLAQAPSIDIGQQSDAKATVIGVNNYYALMQAKDTVWQVPNTGVVGFSLKNAEATILDEGLGKLAAAGVENGRLQLDFGAATFSTGFDLVAGKERFALQAQGNISSTGKLLGNSQFSAPTNMAVNGVVTAENGGTAAYLFQSRLDASRLVYGVTYWTK
nr:FecR family protein [uncultured Undibacterium sp.]